MGAVENVIKNNCKKLSYLINQLSAETTFNIYFLLLLNKTNIDIFDCFSERIRSDAKKRVDVPHFRVFVECSVGSCVI